MYETPQAIPAIWVYTTGSSFNAMRGAGYAAFLTPDQQARLERIRQARLLFDGKHRQYFLDEQRTQFDFPETRIGTRIHRPYVPINVLKLISTKSADLLFGEEPTLRVDDEIQQGFLNDLVDRSNLHSIFYGAAVSGSYEGEAFLEACITDGAVYVRQIQADEIFPIGARQPDGQYANYTRYLVEPLTPQIKLLMEIVYLAGSIERHVYHLDNDGKKSRELSLDQWPVPPADGVALVPVTKTGIDKNTITWIPNELTRGAAASDYDGLIELQDLLNAKETQIARVLAKHSDPKMGFPEASFDEAGNVRSTDEAFPFRTKDELPTYIVWEAQLDMARQDRAFALNLELITAEMSPALLGLKEGAAPDAYRKLRLEAQNALSKAKRKATIWKPGIRRVVGVAQDLEQTIPGMRYDRVPVGVKMRDGIGVDELDQANEISLLVAAKVMSPLRAVEIQLDGDETAVKKEMEELKKQAEADAAAATPSIFMGGHPAVDAGGESGDGASVGGDVGSGLPSTGEQQDQKGVAA